MGLPFLFDALEAFAVLSPVPWLLLARRRSSRPILLAWLGGIAFLFTGLSWLHVVSPIAVLLLALYFGAYEGLSALIVGPLGRRWPCWVVAPLGIATTEALAQHVTIFDVTWLFHGHLAWRCPELLQVAEWGGISLLSAMLWFVAGSTVHLWERRQRPREVASWAPLAASLLVLGGAWLAGAARIASLELHEGPRVALLQGNVPMAVKLSPDAVGAMIRDHLSMTSELEGERLDLVVWPETAVMIPLEAHPEVVGAVAAASRQVGAPILLGAFGLNPTASPPAPSNSAFLIAAEPRLLARQDKRILVPGAETLPVIRFVPLLRDAIGNLLSRTMGFRPNMVAGREAVVMRAGALSLGALICYGDLVPVPAEELRAAGAEALFTLSNEAWFGPRELDQHLAMAVVRSVETRLPMGRATNTGITCVIDPAGRVVERLPRGERGVLVATLPVTSAEPTPAWVRRVPAVLAVSASLFLILAARRRARSNPSC